MKKTNNIDLYGILQVTPNADITVIDAAHKALMKRYHPDHGGNGDMAAKLNEAKDVLLNSKRRKEYDDQMHDRVGGTIGNYKVLELIAEGGFGKTYKGEHLYLKEPVCIKHSHYISKEDEEILRKEAKAIWDLRHHGLPAIRDMVRLEDSSFALVMSYIPGPTLEKIIDKNKKLEPEHVAWISERVLGALWYLHMHGVIHGDVKPQNIIVQPESHAIVLVDYGLSAIQPSHKDGAIGYTPFFAAPEQVNGGPLLPESDFYGLGMTMIYALGGDLAKKRVPSSVPDSLCNFIGKLITHDVLNRPKWENQNLIDEIGEVREKAFGRRRSGMAPIPGV